MKAQIIQIGNSQGIRIPKVLLEEGGISGEVEIELHPDGIMIRKAQKPRAGWAEAFGAMAENEEDELNLEAGPTKFERTEWQW
jgi:antitoxin MazE